MFVKCEFRIVNREKPEWDVGLGKCKFRMGILKKKLRGEVPIKWFLVWEIRISGL